VTRNETARPFLRWAGSKKQLIPVFSELINIKFDRYIEPFAGSACLFFSLTPKNALLSDINYELINSYKQVAFNVDSVLDELKLLSKSKEDYYQIRQLNPERLEPALRAARFIYLNRYCFNGLYRTNRRGQFNVPYCGDSRGTMPSNDVFINASKYLRIAELQTNDFEETLKKAKNGDFVYLDPPFSIKNKNVFKEYDPTIFNENDIYRLRNWMIRMDKSGVFFFVSYAESEEANFLKKGFYSKTVTVRRSIAGFSSCRQKVNEIIISNFSIGN
jgi:DNA adenine methylase